MKYHKNVTYSFRVTYSCNPVLIDYFFTSNGVKNFISKIDSFLLEKWDNESGNWIKIKKINL